MATLETQYKNYLNDNPNSEITFDEWKEWFGNQLVNAFKKMEENKTPKFKIGDKIYKPKGYKFPGTVVSVFKTTSGEIRIVAELEDNGMLHIFSESQLELNNN